MSKPIKANLVGRRVIIGKVAHIKKGDEVLVVRPLRKLVTSSRTGRIMGRDEKIIGRGIVTVNTKGMLEVVLPTTVKVVKPIQKRLFIPNEENEVLVKLINDKTW